jgi:hypothetical protein
LAGDGSNHSGKARTKEKTMDTTFFWLAFAFLQNGPGPGMKALPARAYTPVSLLFSANTSTHISL